MHFQTWSCPLRVIGENLGLRTIHIAFWEQVLYAGLLDLHLWLLSSQKEKKIPCSAAKKGVKVELKERL